MSSLSKLSEGLFHQRWWLSDLKGYLRELNRTEMCPVTDRAVRTILRALPAEQQIVKERGADIAVASKGCHHKLATVVASVKRFNRTVPLEGGLHVF